MNSNRNPQPRTTQPPVHKQMYDPEQVWNFENEWNSKLCECKPFGRCCFSCCCPCCMGCKVAKYTGENQCIGCLLCSLGYLRTKLRVSRRIKGNCCADCCFTRFCMPCAMVQMSRELESQGLWDPPEPTTTDKKNSRR